MMIETEGLRKTFRSKRSDVVAVDGIDLQVPEGQIFGFLGPNGAGKSTTIRMLVTLVRPSGGTARVAGVDLLRDPDSVRRRIGYVAQGGGSDPTVTGRRELVLQGRVHGLAKSDAAAVAERLLDRFELTACADRPTGTWSGGQRRRLDLALGLVHQPPLVFLDEPTTGLDPQSRANLWDEVRDLRQRGTTVLLTTHYLEEADALCDRISIVDHGRIVAEGTPDELKRRIAGDVVTLIVDGDVSRALHLLEGQVFVRSATVADEQLRLYVDRADTATPDILRLLDGAGLTTRSLSLNRPSLDDVFLQQTGRSLRDAGVKGPIVHTIKDTWLTFQRAMGQTVRNPVWVVVGLTQPLFYLFLFGPLLERVTDAQGFPAGGAYNVFVPGLLVQLALIGCAFVGFSLVAELRYGVIERLQVTPVSRVALLFGRCGRDLAVLLVQVVLMVVIAVPFGLDIEPAGLALGVALLLVMGLAFSAVSYTLALVLRSEDALAPLLNVLAVPILLLSGVLLPLSLAPSWLQHVADVNPLSHIVEAARALFNGDLSATAVGQGAIAATVLVVVTVAVASRRFRRAVA